MHSCQTIFHFHTVYMYMYIRIHAVYDVASTCTSAHMQERLVRTRQVTHASLLDVRDECVVTSDLSGLVDAAIRVHGQELARVHLGLQSGYPAHCMGGGEGGGGGVFCTSSYVHV